MSDAPQPLLVVVGPTGSGKTELAIRLAEALNGEIVSADSVQIYRHFDIGSAKPTPSELERAPHHLIGVIEPLAELDAQGYVALAQASIAEIRGRGRVPIVCGGTFLWVRALLYGLAAAPSGNAELRGRHEQLAAREGRAALHAELARVDPVSAARLHSNDFVRVSRALEVFELSGRKMSDIQAEHGFRTARYDAQLLGLGWERTRYEQRLRARVSSMLASGFIEEVEQLLAQGFGSARAMAAVGYRQVQSALTSPAPLDRAALALEIDRATRIFARRQRTWLREQPVNWLPAEQLDEPATWDAVLARARAHQSQSG